MSDFHPGLANSTTTTTVVERTVAVELDATLANAVDNRTVTLDDGGTTRTWQVADLTATDLLKVMYEMPCQSTDTDCPAASWRLEVL